MRCTFFLCAVLLTQLLWASRSHDRFFKIIFLGDSGVGKSALYTRMALPNQPVIFENYITTIGMDYGTRILRMNSEALKFQIWDTAGQERFRAIVRSFMQNVDGAFLVYDVTDPESFGNIGLWLEDLERHASPVLFLLGNKTDLVGKRRVTTEEGENLAQKLGMQFREVSARTEDGVSKAFQEMATTLQMKAKQRDNDAVIRLDGSDGKGKGKCCS